MKNPKIIATIGPSSQKYEIFKKLAESGMNIVRVNFSYGTKEQWEEILRSIDQVKKETGISLEIMADLQGPRIRLGILPQEITLTKDTVYSFTTKEPDYTKNELPIDFPELYKFVEPGHAMFLSNRLVEMVVEKVEDKKIFARTIRGGTINSRKGINLPQTQIKNTLSAKDKDFAVFTAHNGAKFMCLSFVQEAKDVESLRKLIENPAVKIISKIERASALDNIDSIIKASDGIMIARGDLGIEIPIEELCIVQKNLVRHAHQYNKPAIVATQMLDSMNKNPSPTRAEAADISNAIFDGADCTMLSDETAAGMYPVESVAMMKKIITRVDQYLSMNYFDYPHNT